MDSASLGPVLLELELLEPLLFFKATAVEAVDGAEAVEHGPAARLFASCVLQRLQAMAGGLP